jgi:NAD(P)H-hydrate repair Nnr-like enzyme with NAD(P)H-hydrate dehydratase domain
MAAACLTADVLGIEAPQGIVAGDTGGGQGSARVYELVAEQLNRGGEDLIVFHYLLPEINWHNKIFWKIEGLPQKPLLVADAGYMYVAKMSGMSPSYDLFTPDAGEMAFLADESAPHPFYTRGFLLQDEERVPELIRRAYENENAAKYLLVKGSCDYVASASEFHATISEPCVPNMEPIGGTGDTLTGIVAALLAAGYSVPEAAEVGARVNRVMGLLSRPTPAFSVADLLPSLPKAIEIVLGGQNLP